MRRLVSLIAIALVSSLVISGTAVAAAGSTSTTFKMVDKGTHVTYKGKVSSNQQRCIGDRKVIIIHNGVRIARDTTNADGEWQKDGPRPPVGDKVKAKVKKKRKNGQTICRATSVTKTFNP